ncbi:MAG: anti-sigma factor antagonist [Frankiaceae bacterium]|jgi:anti-sigma B factor antagonist|nr:anti-sigma factor antagonist [Frankiaceae bacterium]
MRRNMLSLTLEGDVTVVEVHGCLDIATVEPLRTVLSQLRRDADVVVDIRDVDFCDSSGVSVLAGAAYNASVAGHELTVRHAHPSVEHVLRLTGCDWLLSAGA